MGIPISTIGLKVSWAVETTKGTRPTSGYKVIHNLKSFPDTNVAPETADATTFDQTKNTISVTLLKDMSGALEMTANLCDELETEWNEMFSASDTAKKTEKATWFCVEIPGFTKATYLPVSPQKLEGMSELSANSLAEVTVRFTVTGDGEMGDKPTYATTSASLLSD